MGVRLGTAYNGLWSYYASSQQPTGLCLDVVLNWALRLWDLLLPKKVLWMNYWTEFFLTFFCEGCLIVLAVVCLLILYIICLSVGLEPELAS